MTTSKIQILADLFKKGEFDRVVEVCLPLMKDDVLVPEELNILAAAYYKLGYFDDCISVCEKLYPILKEDSAFVGLFGASLRRSCQLARAESIFKERLLQDPDNPILSNNFANLLIDLGKITESIEVLTKVIDSCPGYVDAINNLDRARLLSVTSVVKSLTGVDGGHTEEPCTDRETRTSSQRLASISEALPIIDPLLDCFDTSEIIKDEEKNILLSGNIKGVDSDIADFISDLTSIVDTDQMLDDVIRQVRLLLQASPMKAISLCNSLVKKYGILPAIFSVASEAYIAGSDFIKAENTALFVLALGSQDLTCIVNLANLSAMRNDMAAAKHWIELAKKLYPASHVVLEVDQRLHNGFQLDNSSSLSSPGRNITYNGLVEFHK